MKSSGAAASQQSVDQAPQQGGSAAENKSASSPVVQASFAANAAPLPVPTPPASSASVTANTLQQRLARDELHFRELRRNVMLAIATIGEWRDGREIDVGGMKVNVLEHVARQWDIVSAVDTGKISPSDAIRQIVWTGQQGFYNAELVDNIRSSYSKLKIKEHYSQYFSEEKSFVSDPRPTMEQQVDEFVFRIPIVFAQYQQQQAMPIAKFFSADANAELASVFMLGKNIIENMIKKFRDVVLLVKQECPDERVGKFLDDTLHKIAECGDLNVMKIYLQGFKMIYADACKRFPNVDSGRAEIERTLHCFERIHEINLKDEKDPLNSAVFMFMRSMAMEMLGVGFLNTLHDVAKEASDISDSADVINTSIYGAQILREETLQDKNSMRKGRERADSQIEKMIAMLKSVSNKELTAVEIGVVATLTFCAPHAAPLAVPIVKGGSTIIKNFLSAFGEIQKNTATAQHIDTYEKLGLRLHHLLCSDKPLKSVERVDARIESVVFRDLHEGTTNNIINWLADKDHPVHGFAVHSKETQVQSSPAQSALPLTETKVDPQPVVQVVHRKR